MVEPMNAATVRVLHPHPRPIKVGVKVAFVVVAVVGVAQSSVCEVGA